MLETLLHFDQQLFFAINHGLSNPFFDWLMPLLRNKYSWAPLYLFVIVYFIRQYGRTGIMLVCMLLLTFVLADNISSSIIKPAVGRLRPCNDPEINAQVNSLVGCGTGYSFPSSHAANHFALAMYMIIACHHRWKWILPVALLWAFSVSFAQIYVGVHYPVDITAGAFLGCLIGYFTSTIFLITQRKTEWKPGK